MASRWYVVQTKNRLERFASDQLFNQSYEVFYPAYRNITQVGKLTKSVVLPLYPSYIFVRFDISERAWRSINGTRGVQGIIGAGEDTAIPLPVGFVEAMMSKLNGEGLVTIEESVQRLIQFAPGTQLVVKSSNFNGLVGTCVESTSKRVTLFLSLLSREIKVSLPLHSVEAL